MTFRLPRFDLLSLCRGVTKATAEDRVVNNYARRNGRMGEHLPGQECTLVARSVVARRAASLVVLTRWRLKPRLW